LVDPLNPSAIGGTTRTTLRRIPEKAVTDRATLNAVLDAGLVAHVGMVDGEQPFVVPVAYARDGDRVLIHGSTASRLFRSLAAGAPACLSVTLLDALVVARSAFESSMHYRSVMALGRFTELTGEEHFTGLRLITEHLLPGRWDEVRAPLPKELKATMVLAMALDEASVKISDGPPDDPDDDVAGDAWAGVLPLTTSFGSPVEAPDLRDGIPIPTSVNALLKP
jgi:nitroimidazol reductase NimA-like FMN-containing flavoprotein (pyridoxamine 5'-phosphate oxidase superfamily)